MILLRVGVQRLDEQAILSGAPTDPGHGNRTISMVRICGGNLLFHPEIARKAVIPKGERLIIEPAPKTSLLALLTTAPELDEDFGPIDDLPAEPVDL